MADDDHAVASQLVAEAGETLRRLRTERGFGDPDALRAAGDRTAHDLLMARLAHLRPGDAVLSEEGVDDPVRLSSERVWIVDPLDGTREFGEPGREDWAVHVALWQQGDLVAGAIGLPARELTLSTADPVGPPTSGELRIVVSRSRAPEVVHRIADDLGARLVPMGSAGAKVAAVMLGEAQAYVHAGGQYEWDSAAPVAAARAAGLHCSRLDGAPLRYNQPDPYLPDLLVCLPELTDALVAALAEART